MSASKPHSGYLAGPGGIACVAKEDYDRLFEQYGTLHEAALMLVKCEEELAPPCNSCISRLRELVDPSNPASEPPVDGENLAARVQQVQHLLDKGDEAELIAYLIGRPVEDVRRVVGSPASIPRCTCTPGEGFGWEGRSPNLKGPGHDRDCPMFSTGQEAAPSPASVPPPRDPVKEQKV